MDTININTYPNSVNVTPESGEPILAENNFPKTTRNVATSRFSGADWYEEVKNNKIILAGVGGIGSHLAFLLSRIYPTKMDIYDDDIVEVANRSGQLFSFENEGQAKTSAIADFIYKYSKYPHIISHRQKFLENSPAGPVMLCGFDNMEARKTFYNSWKKFIKGHPEIEPHCIFIDGRLAAEEFQVFCIEGTNEYAMKKYEEKWLFSNQEADPTVCSYKQTTFMASMIASVMTNLFVNFCANKTSPLMERDLPFLTQYDGTLMLFKTEV